MCKIGHKYCFLLIYQPLNMLVVVIGVIMENIECHFKFIDILFKKQMVVISQKGHHAPKECKSIVFS